MIKITLDPEDLSKVTVALGGINSKSKKVLKDAVNKTAKDARERLVNKAAEDYALHAKKSEIGGATKVKKATSGRIEAVIESKGHMNDLIDFKVSPKRVSNGKKPKIYRASVLTGEGMKALQKGSIKAFVAHFASGHTGVVERVEGRGRYIRSLYGPAVPLMVGSLRVFGDDTQEEISDELHKNIEAELTKALGGGT